MSAGGVRRCQRAGCRPPLMAAIARATRPQAGRGARLRAAARHMSLRDTSPAVPLGLPKSASAGSSPPALGADPGCTPLRTFGDYRRAMEVSEAAIFNQVHLKEGRRPCRRRPNVARIAVRGVALRAGSTSRQELSKLLRCHSYVGERLRTCYLCKHCDTILPSGLRKWHRAAAS